MRFLRVVRDDGLCSTSSKCVVVAVKVGNLWDAGSVPETHESGSCAGRGYEHRLAITFSSATSATPSLS